MAEGYQRRVDVILDAAYLDDLGSRSIDEVREAHDLCLEVETEVAYVRRLAQARIDIVEAELDRRAQGGSIGDLVAALPDILAAEPTRPEPAAARLPRYLAPSMSIQWRRGLEHLIADATLVNLPTLPEDELRSTLVQLRELEIEASDRRRALHRVLDTVEAELVSRHKVERT
jgi:hypothetical protein